ncbi:unnamed protein product [Hymenolepis diminuta]|uniref:Uncharacterized protein n=1 Tax=Hymenolepis diminuta TaxID=6216 RepID=A0A564Z9A0_HYMDI|nr:unnamed protein product [Hymenolepis diminuta]
MQRTDEGQRGRANQQDASRKGRGEKPGYLNRLEYHVPVYKQVPSTRDLHRYSLCNPLLQLPHRQTESFLTPPHCILLIHNKFSS